MDVIGCTRIYGRVHDRLLRGYMMDAMGETGLPERTAQGYLESAQEARRVGSDTVGLGE